MNMVASNSAPRTSSFAKLALVYFLSGGCGLIYQTVWIRFFSKLFGSTILSMSVVVAVFFGGLAIGSRYFGRIADRSANPIRLYGILEILVGLYALAFPYIIRLADMGYGWLHGMISHDPLSLTGARLFTAALVLLPPTIGMGATLPVLTRYFITSLDTTGRRAGLVYGLNTLGAAAGCLAAGYFLMHTIGVNATNSAAAVLNLALGGWAFMASRNVSAQPSYPSAGFGQSEPGASSLQWIGLCLCFGLSGFVSLAYEIVWLRYALFFFRDTNFLYSGIISIFILGIGLGSLIFGWLANKTNRPGVWFSVMQVCVAVSVMLSLWLPIPMRSELFMAGESDPFSILVFLFKALIVPTLCMGASFPLMSKVVSTELASVGDKIGRAYSANVIGSILGSLAAGFLFFEFMGMKLTLIILFCLAGVCASLMLYLVGGKTRFLSPVPAIVMLTILIGVQGEERLELPTVLIEDISRGQAVLEVRETPTGTTWATRTPGSNVISLVENQIVISKSDSFSFAMQGFIPAVALPGQPRKVLGLCFGGGLSYLGPRLMEEMESIDLVDISEGNIALALSHIPQNNEFGADPKSRFIVDDAYNYLKYGDSEYDLVIMEPTPPLYSFRCAALYTLQFYSLAAGRLSEGGLFSQALPISHMTDSEIGSVLGTFAKAFPHCVLWWNGFEPVMIGSNQPIRLNTKKMAEIIARPKVKKALKAYSGKADFTHIAHFASGLLMGRDQFLAASSGLPIVTDDKNLLERTTWQDVSASGIERLHENLIPWKDGVAFFDKSIPLERYLKELAARREFLMRELYGTNRK